VSIQGWPFNDRVSQYIGPPFFDHKSPAYRARELFKSSTDSASLVVNNEKKNFVLDLSFSGGIVTSRGVFALFWPSLPGSGRRPNGPSMFWTQSLVEN